MNVVQLTGCDDQLNQHRDPHAVTPPDTLAKSRRYTQKTVAVVMSELLSFLHCRDGWSRHRGHVVIVVRGRVWLMLSVSV